MPFEYTQNPVTNQSGTWDPVYGYTKNGRYVAGWKLRPKLEQAQEQAIAAPVASSVARKDATPENTKKPQQFLGKQQSEASAGTTIPIVFGKRENDIGGIWVQPTLLKTGYTSFSYAISQGYIKSYPFSTADKSTMWIGTKNLQYIRPIVTTVDAYWQYLFEDNYTSGTTNVCPINYRAPTPGNIYCDRNSYAFVGPLFTTSGASFHYPDVATYYLKTMEVTKADGFNTDNSVIRYNNSDIYIYDSNTGADITAAYWAYYGINPVGTYTYVNAVYSGATIIGGRLKGTATISGWVAPVGPRPYTTGPEVFTYGSGTLINQINPALPVDPDTLYGVQVFWEQSLYPNPGTSPPSSKNFISFSDITFLRIDGAIFDQALDTFQFFDVAAPEPYPTSVRQLSIFLDSGVQVDLYSQPLLPPDIFSPVSYYDVGPSNQFVDLAMYLFALLKRAKSWYSSFPVTPEPSFVDVIDTSNMQALATFCSNTGLFFNGVVDQSVNAVEYIGRISPFFLLSFIIADGQYKFLPILPLTAGNQIKVTALTPDQVFTEDDILPGSFVKAFYGPEDLRPTTVSLVWNNVTRSFIGDQVTTTVRYPETSSSAPTVQFDMTDFCTTQAHAVVYAKYELARRKYSTHAITFSTPLLTTGLVPTQIIRVERTRINSRGDNRTEIDWYQVSKVSHTTNGSSTIEAIHFPVNGSNISVISNEVVNGTFVVL